MSGAAPTTRCLRWVPGSPSSKKKGAAGNSSASIRPSRRLRIADCGNWNSNLSSIRNPQSAIRNPKMQFLDRARIIVRGGDGGNGVTAFRREKFVPRGGPSGGDGGHGGTVYVVASPHINTLINFRFHPEFSAERGEHGMGSNRTGHGGADLELAVPIGTLVYEKTGDPDEPLRLLADLAEEGQKVLVAKGGRGGLGNARFATSTNRAPRKVQPGESGEIKELRLELKLLADVGLVGFPNAGKSTLISRISAARPKIADYPFTTLTPNLGVVRLSDE